MKTYRFVVEFTCATDTAQADLSRAEDMLDLSMQELVFDDEFVEALGETEGLQVSVVRVN
jgi:hypothetical protein